MAEPNPLSGQMESAWKSERLTYRAVEDTEEDRKCVHEVMNTDPVIFGQNWRLNFKPPARYVTDEYFDVALKNDLLAVMICLPAAQEDKSGAIHPG